MAVPPPAIIDPRVSIIRSMWAAISVLHPLTGTRANSVATATATGAPAVIPLGTYALPTVSSPTGNAWQGFGHMLKVVDDTTVTSAGTPVAMVSVSGGIRQNLPAGTLLEWYPYPPPGVGPTAVLAGDATGATDPTAIGGVRQVLTVEGMGQTQAARAIWNAGTDTFPAVVIAWEGATDGGMNGANKMFRRHQLRAFVIAARLDGQNRRRDEGLLVLADVERELSYRAEVDGEVFSQPPIQPGNLGRLTTDAGSYVYHFAFIINHTSVRIDRREGTYQRWRKSRVQITTTPDTTPQGGTELVDVDETVDMP